MLDYESEACQDYQTKLLNRRGLEADMNGLRMEDMPVAVYLFDLDNLKQVNDQQGHDAGDRLIGIFAEVLRRHSRQTDLLCRYGGDEFVLHIGSPEIVLRKGEAICQDFNITSAHSGRRAACSGGVVLSGKDEKLSQKQLTQADEALYRAKHQGRGICCLWEPSFAQC